MRQINPEYSYRSIRWTVPVERLADGDRVPQPPAPPPPPRRRLRDHGLAVIVCAVILVAVVVVLDLAGW
jgi:hypothetical protein